MAQDAYPVRATAPECREHVIRLLGTGASAPTVQYGYGVTCTRTAAGVYKLTWSENPGVFLGASATLAAATPGDIKNHSVVFDTYDATTRTLELTFWDASAAAHDLAAVEYLHLIVRFKQTGV